MPRICGLDDASNLSEEGKRILAFAEVAGAPDPRMARVLLRTPLGTSFLRFWSEMLYDGLLPHRLKEIVRIYMSASEGCAYCTSVRSTQGRTDGVSDDLLLSLDDIEGSPHLSDREQAALRYCRRFKDGKADEDKVFDELRTHFSEEEILELGLFCGTVSGIGGFAKLLRVVNWEEACELRPDVAKLRTLRTAD